MSRSLLLATAAVSLLTSSRFLVHGHTLMQKPVPFPSQLSDNGPMAKDGSNWPCSGEAEFDPHGIVNIWERQSTQQLQWAEIDHIARAFTNTYSLHSAMGGASHGGGSCQISVTYDPKPTKKSEWKVIHSIEGGCPIRNLTEDNYGSSATTLLPSVYNFTIPDWLPLGSAIMAWTWYGRWSVPEMFMNCAPIMVLGGFTGKDINDSVLETQWKNAPLMFEANNGNGCWTANRGSCVKFPQPGHSLEVNHECPFSTETMFTGTCGPEQRLALLGGTSQIPFPIRNRPILLTFVLLLSCALVVSLAKVFFLHHRKRGGVIYSRLPVFGEK